jgi:hypothetical protein
MSKKLYFTLIIGALIISVLACEGGDTSESPVREIAEAIPEVENEDIRSQIVEIETPTNIPPTDTPVIGLIKIGTYIVGTDIEPGIYKGYAGDNIVESCYWARLNDLSSDLNSVISNENEIGQYYIEIKESDFAFETQCELLKLENTPPPENNNPTILKSGIYLIGRDIQPGMYKGEAGPDVMESCYWARLTDVSGELNSIISNENAVGQFYIQVLDSDFALKVGCQVEHVTQ